MTLSRSFGLLVLVALSASGFGGLAAARPKPPTPLDLKHMPPPVWLEKPSELAMTKVFPEKAMKDHVAGVAVMRCKIIARTLEGCVATAEDPAGYGFGEAAVKLAGTFHLAPVGPGVPPDGETINVPIRFGAWMYRRPPPINLHPGDAAILMTGLKGARPPGRSIFPCPDTIQSRYCVWAGVTWTQRPDRAATRAALQASDMRSGHAQLTCSATVEGALADCRASGDVNPKAEAALQRLAQDFRLAPKAEDGTPVTDGRVVVEINWALFHAVSDDRD